MASINYNKEFYIYSTHKTATQTLKSSFNTNHIHEVKNINYTPEQFENDVKKYYAINKRKIKIITVLRSPSKRVISSYFQLKHDREIRINKVNKYETTIMKNDIDYLISDISNFILNEQYPKESLYEILKIFNFSVDDIIIREKYGFYENNIIELYVLDFDIITSKEKMKYLTDIFGNKVKNYNTNKSDDKIYYNKYQIIKEHIGIKFDEMIDIKLSDIVTLKNKINK
jgi:hypothetical protein